MERQLRRTGSVRENGARLTDFAQFRHAARFHPFRNKDVPILIKPSIVGVNEFAWLPFVAHAAHFEAGQCDLAPRFVVAELRDDFVVFVEDRHAAVQVGHQQQVALNVDVGGEEEAVEF